VRRLITLAVLAVLASASGLVEGSPQEGGIAIPRVRLEAQDKRRLPPLRFKGNERACAILMGDHRPVVDLAIYVYDEKGTLVAKDDAGLDYCAAIWYPPRTATYTIVLENKGREYNDCYLSLK
jgi:hypothetical protein